MPIEIRMPALSPTMTEGNLTRWLKKEGDEVHSGDVIAEIETDKATMEYEAADEGRLGKIIVPEGAQGIKVNQPIALLLEEGEDQSALDKFASSDQVAPMRGSGPQGRIVKTDIDRALMQPGAAVPPHPAAVPPAAPIFAKEQMLALAGDPPFVEKPHSAMRRVIARRLAEAKQTIPHFY